MSTFKMTLDLFTACAAAIAAGSTLAKHAANVASCGVTDAKTFSLAYATFASEQAETLSYTAIQHACNKASKPAKASKTLALLASIDVHNKAHSDSAPVVLALSLSEDGARYSLCLTVGAKARKARKRSTGGTVSAGSHIAAPTIAKNCHEEDGYTFTGSSKEDYAINGVKVPAGKFMQTLKDMAPTNAATHAMLTKYGKL